MATGKVGGISKKNGDWYVRLNHLGIRYAPKNYTKIFGCKTEEDTIKKVEEVKLQLSQGMDPFAIPKPLNEYMEDRWKRVAASTAKIEKLQYDKHVKPHIGNYKPYQIIDGSIEKIYNHMVSDPSVRSEHTIDKVRRMLNPVFEKLRTKGLMKRNPLLAVEIPKLETHKELAPLDFRLKDERFEKVVHELYEVFSELQQPNQKAHLLMSLMTVRRHTELNVTKREYIKNGIVYAPGSITKTKINERYPLPAEIIEIIESTDDEYPFKLPESTKRNIWDDIKGKNPKKEGKLSFKVDDVFKVHDYRRLFQSIMNKKYNRGLVGACSSRHKGDVNEIYSEYEFEDRVEVFEAYWEVIRGQKSIKATGETIELA